MFVNQQSFLIFATEQLRKVARDTAVSKRLALSCWVSIPATIICLRARYGNCNFLGGEWGGISEKVTSNVDQLYDRFSLCLAKSGYKKAKEIVMEAEQTSAGLAMPFE